MKTKPNRVFEIDFLRGFAILLVIFDHAMYDFGKIFGSLWIGAGNAFLENLSLFGLEYCYSDLRAFWRPAFLFIFFCTSGICTSFSRNNLTRGLKLGAVAMCISLISALAGDILGADYFVLFGVLHCLATIILVYTAINFLLEKLFKLFFILFKKPYNENLVRYVLSVLYLALSAVFFYIHFKYNVTLYDADNNYLTIISDSKIIGLFFFHRLWWTADYFPLFPFIAFFYVGAGLAHLLYPRKKTLFPLIEDKVWHKPISLAGKYSIFFYLGGQVFSLAFGAVASLICFGTIS